MTHRRGKPCVTCGRDEWRVSNGQCVYCSRRRQRERQRLLRDLDPMRDLWETARRRAQRKFVDFDITVEDLEAAWPADGRCPVLGLVLQRGRGFTQDQSPTVDRLNPDWGYVPGNVVIMSHRANRAKGNLRAAELEKIAVWMRAQGLD